MRIATVFAAIVLTGATLAPAFAQNKSAPDEIEGFWVYSKTKEATCRTPDVEKEIGFFTWMIAQDQKELQERQARAAEIRASMTKSLMSGKATGSNVDYEVKAATESLQYQDGKIHELEDRIARAQRAKKYFEGLPPCVPGTEHATETPPPPPKTVPSDVAPEHSSVMPPPSTAVPASIPGYPRAPFYNRPYNSPLDWLFYNAPFYNRPYNTPYNRLAGFYLGVDGGPSFVPTVMATEFFNDGKNRFPWGSSTGFYFGAQAGWENDHWRFEGQYTWSRNPAAATMPLPANVRIGGDTEIHGFFGNAIYTPPFVFGLPVTPHIGVGVGALDVSTTIKVNDIKVFDSSSWAPGAQAIGGLTWQVSPRLSLDLNYSYQTTLGDVDYKSLANGNNPRNKVTAPYHASFILLGLNLHFPVAEPPAAPAAPPPRSAVPRAHQVASLAPVETASAAAHRFTLRYDAADTVLTASSVRVLHDALDAIEAGLDVRIAVAGCESDADYADGSPCARHALRLRHLLARYGVENPSHLLVRG